MCDPTLGLIGVQVLGTLLNTQGAIAGAEAQRSSLLLDATLSDIAAEDARSRGAQASTLAKLRASRTRKTQRARFAASGVLANTGTAADVQLQTTELGGIEAKIIATNAEREALGLERRARLARGGARDINPALAGFTTLLSGLSPLARSFSPGTAASDALATN